MQKKFMFPSLVLLFIVLTGFTGCQRNYDPNDGKMKVALLFSGPADDQNWNTAALEGLKEAEELYDIVTAFRENVAAADGEAAYTEFASQGYDLVIGCGLQFGDPAVRVSARFPNTKFVAIDANVFSLNAASYIMACEEAGFLMGILAASMSMTGRIGIVGGFEHPQIVKVVEAYKTGARLYNHNIIIYNEYIDSLDDEIKGRDAALSMANMGADILSHAAGQAGIGVIKAAEDLGLFATGDAFDQNPIAPNTVVCSTIYNIPAMALTAVENVRNNTFVGGIFNLGLRDGVVDIASYHGFEYLIPMNAKNMIADYKGRIERGAYVVPVIETRTF